MDGYIGLGTGPLAHFCNDGNEPWFSTKSEEFLGLLKEASCSLEPVYLWSQLSNLRARRLIDEVVAV